jgi:hypothetical protein
MAIIKVGDKATAPSVRPSLLLDFANSKSIDPRAAFYRTSTATYYDGNTKVKAEENQIKWSQEIDNSYWDLGGITVSTNAATAPDGTSTADEIIPSTAYQEHWVGQTEDKWETNKDSTFSIYAKSNTSGYHLQLRSHQIGSGYVYVNFDLTNGTVGTSGGSALVSSSITTVGGGWYRCAVTTNTSNASGEMKFIVVDSISANEAQAFAGNGSSGIYVWGAQQETRSSATIYTPTTDKPVIRYQSALQTAPAHVPRFDHDPITGESKGLLLETSQRTNLVIKSEDFANSAWNYNNYGNWRYAGHSQNVAIAPDGTLTADTYESSVTIQTLTQRQSCSPNTEYTVSAWIKATKLSTAHLYFITSHGDSSNVLIDYPTTWIGNRDDRLNDKNEWVRVSHTWTTPSNAASFEVGFTSGYDVPQNRNAELNQWLVWGIQVEAGNYMSSYIKTDTAQVTRSGENCQVNIDDSSDWYAKGKGTLYVEGAVGGFVTSQGLAGLRDLNDAGATWNGVYVSPNGQVLCSNYSYKYGGNQGGNISTTAGFVTLNEFSRSAFSFSQEYGAGAISKSDTVEVEAERSNMNIPEHDILYVGRLGSGYSIQIGHIKKVAYYPEALDVNELVALVEE